MRSFLILLALIVPLRASAQDTIQWNVFQMTGHDLLNHIVRKGYGLGNVGELAIIPKAKNQFKQKQAERDARATVRAMFADTKYDREPEFSVSFITKIDPEYNFEKSRFEFCGIATVKMPISPRFKYRYASILFQAPTLLFTENPYTPSGKCIHRARTVTQDQVNMETSGNHTHSAIRYDLIMRNESEAERLYNNVIEKTDGLIEVTVKCKFLEYTKPQYYSITSRCIIQSIEATAFGETEPFYSIWITDGDVNSTQIIRNF